MFSLKMIIYFIHHRGIIPGQIKKKNQEAEYKNINTVAYTLSNHPFARKLP